VTWLWLSIWLALAVMTSVGPMAPAALPSALVPSRRRRRCESWWSSLRLRVLELSPANDVLTRLPFEQLVAGAQRERSERACRPLGPSRLVYP
jgi:hypothetical protein